MAAVYRRIAAAFAWIGRKGTDQAAARRERQASRRPTITVQQAPAPTVVRRRLPGGQALQDTPDEDEEDPDISEYVANGATRQPQAAPQPARAAQEPVKRATIPRGLSLEDWVLPEVSLLTEAPAEAREPGIDQEKTSGLIESTLREYGIEVKVEEVKVGPVVTMFGLVPGWVRRARQSRSKTEENNDEDRTRVRVDSIVARERDLALALAAPSLRIEAPIPGASLVGIEVPNPRPASVTLRGVMETDAYKELLEKSKLALGLGLGSGRRSRRRRPGPDAPPAHCRLHGQRQERVHEHGHLLHDHAELPLGDPPASH